MTLQSAIEQELPVLRAEAKARMKSTAVVESVKVSADRMTGRDVETPAVIHAAIRCRVKSGGQSVRSSEVGGAGVSTLSTSVHFPWDTTGLRVGLRVRIVSSDTPSVVGKTYRLVVPHEGDQATAQRWGVESWPTVSTN